MPFESEPKPMAFGEIPTAPRAAQGAGVREQVTLARECEAILVPAGTPVTLPAGSQVTITQELGGDFTVVTSWGYMVRIAGEDADALGREAPARAGNGEAKEFSEEAVWSALSTIYDPEIPVNIVDLGLIYGVESFPRPDGERRVDVRMTLTAPGCGMGEVLKQDVERKVGSLPGVDEVNVEVVFDPPWGPNMMSEAARLELGLF
jgi:probable FeS assembly SUF system protein SufT